MSDPSAIQVLLEQVRDSMGAVPGVATSRVGLEVNMTPDDYPMVRIIPQRIAEGLAIGGQAVDVLIYFGQPIHEFSSGLETLYWEQFRMRDALLTALQDSAPAFYCQHHETVLDDERVEAYKLFCMRCTIEQ